MAKFPDLNQIKQLFGQTLIYGLGTIVPRFLNFVILTPYYTRIFNPSQYGVITELYSYIVVFMILLTYGLETGFFRYAKTHKNYHEVFYTSLISLFVTSGLFVLVIYIFLTPLSAYLEYREYQNLVFWTACIVAIDAFTSIFFAKLRWENRGLRFSLLKIVNVAVIVGLVIFFMDILPSYAQKHTFFKHIYNSNFTVEYVFIANLAASFIVMVLLISGINFKKISFNFGLYKNLLMYSFPLLIAGLAGAMNDALDKILLKHLIRDADGLNQLGIYGANYKLAVIMTLFIQMFRYAFEPFFFSNSDQKNIRELYAEVMKYFLLFCFVIFLVITFYIDIVKYFIGADFRSGLNIVPIILVANIFYGIFINLSVWYKLNDLTKYGALLTITGVIVTVAINVIFVPVYGFIAAAWGHLFCYVVMVIMSYFLGRKFYKINYQLKSLFLYTFVTFLLFYLEKYININNQITDYLVKTLLLLTFLIIIIKREKIYLKFKRR